MAKAKEKETKRIEPLAGESCTLDELNKWSAGRWLAGQHQAALDVQKRYEVLARHENPGRDLEFHRDEETGELSFGVGKTEEELMAELEAEEKAKKEADEKAKKEADEKAKKEAEEKAKRGGQ